MVRIKSHKTFRNRSRGLSTRDSLPKVEFFYILGAGFPPRHRLKWNFTQPRGPTCSSATPNFTGIGAASRPCSTMYQLLALMSSKTLKKTYAKREKTARAWFSRLLQYPTTKRRSILSTTERARGTKDHRQRISRFVITCYNTIFRKINRPTEETFFGHLQSLQIENSFQEKKRL